MSYALFPQVAMKFFEARDKKEEAQAPAPAAPAPEKKAEAPAKEGVRTLYVEDLTENM